nr:HNH endonuclease family protein [Ktedonobacteraceae bacterium]
MDTPCALLFLPNWHQPHLVLRFLKDLERLVVSFIVCRMPPYRRFERYCEILNAIYDRSDLYGPKSPLQLNQRECQDFLRRLNGDIYLMHHICRYILLRLDDSLSEGTASYDYETISVEHVLPQRPSPESKWVEMFPTKEIRQQYVHRLGNLVLLSRGKNMKAENYDFDVKKETYFRTKDGISSFVLTSQVLRHDNWTPLVIEQRQNESISALKRIWRL